MRVQRMVDPLAVNPPNLMDKSIKCKKPKKSGEVSTVLMNLAADWLRWCQKRLMLGRFWVVSIKVGTRTASGLDQRGGRTLLKLSDLSRCHDQIGECLIVISSPYSMILTARPAILESALYRLLARCFIAGFCLSSVTGARPTS